MNDRETNQKGFEDLLLPLLPELEDENELMDFLEKLLKPIINFGQNIYVGQDEEFIY